MPPYPGLVWVAMAKRDLAAGTGPPPIVDANLEEELKKNRRF